MKSFEIKARDYYGEVVINKGLMATAGFGSRALPVYVGEWIISQFLGKGGASMNPAGSRSPASWENIFRKKPTKIES